MRKRCTKTWERESEMEGLQFLFACLPAGAAEDRVQVVTAPPVAVVAAEPQAESRAPAPSDVAADVVDAVMRLPVHIHEEPRLSLPTGVADATLNLGAWGRAGRADARRSFIFPAPVSI